MTSPLSWQWGITTIDLLRTLSSNSRRLFAAAAGGLLAQQWKWWQEVGWGRDYSCSAFSSSWGALINSTAWWSYAAKPAYHLPAEEPSRCNAVQHVPVLLAGGSRGMGHAEAIPSHIQYTLG